ncbi:hypothetical protein ID866_3925 [Astraeus odoratus]|nr:hypothetical protein ID866_3925 [Astraeus odoratus]
MTEYLASPEPIEIFRDSEGRTGQWVRSHSPYNGQFRSPDSPPSVIGELDVEGRESDEGSSHSLPPKMMLRYPDGRGNVPISHWHYDGHRHHYPHRDAPFHGPVPRSRPHTPHRSPDDGDFDSAPEEIQILPADPNVQPQRVTGSYRPRRSSEPFHPREQPVRNRVDEELYDTPPPRYVSTTLNVPTAAPMVYSHSQHIHDPYDHHHPSHSHSRGNRPPPSIVYAPAPRHNTDHYAPPTIVYSSSHKAAPGMSHTVSAPTGSGFPQYSRIATVPHPPMHSHLNAVHEEPRYAPKGPRPREDLPRAHTPISEAASGDSSSTYYVLPTPGQKVKVLVGPEPSLYHGSSTTKSGSSPRTPESASGHGLRRPFFSRLISFATDFSKGPRSSRKNLHRRHSVDAGIPSRAHSRDRR